MDSKQNHMSGLAFPLTDATVEAIETFKNSGTDYVQLSIDLNKEIITVTNKSTCTVQQLPDKVPEDAPRYHLFRFSHTHEGDFLKSVGKYFDNNKRLLDNGLEYIDISLLEPQYFIRFFSSFSVHFYNAWVQLLYQR